MNRGTWTAEQIEQWDVEKLKPYEKNARTHSEKQIEQIAASIGEFGFTNPILATGDGRIVAGHGRLQAAKKLKFKDVPVVVVDHLTQEQIKAYTLADNKLALNAGWDNDLLSVELSELAATGYDISLIGFDEGELSELLGNAESELEGDPDEVPEVQEVATTQLGDLWVMGEHRLLCGDSTSVDALDLLMKGAKADLLITDPPYNVSYEGKTKDALTIKNDSMSDTDFRQFLRDVFSLADSVMKPGAVFYIWHADSEGYNFRGAAFDVQWKIRQCLIWNKNTLVLGRQDYHWKHEPCLYGWKDGAAHYWGNDRTQTTVLEFNKPSRNGEHPTMKPVDLFEYQIKNSSRKNEIVLDLFGGSGTTIIAAEKLNRKARLVELDPKYCDVIIKRWQQLTSKEAINEKTGERFNDVLKRG